MGDIIKIYNTVSKDKINTIISNSFEIDEIVSLKRIINDIEINLPTIQKAWIDSGLATWIADTAAMNQVRFNYSVTKVPMVYDSDRLTNMGSMFAYCSRLTEIPLIDTINTTDMCYMFSGCTSLTSIPELDISNVIDMNSMFRYCTSLTTIPLINTSNVTYMNSMFIECSGLTEIPELVTSNVTDMNQMFYNCEKLVTCKLKGIKVDLDLKDSPLLNVESIRYIMNNSQIVTNQTLTINSTAWRNSGLTDTSPDVVAFKAKGWTFVH